MRWNATYRYRNANTKFKFEDGGACFILNANTEQLVDSDWGKDKILKYTMYVRDRRKIFIDWGTVVEVSMQDGQQFICTVTGIDFTISRLYTFTITNSLPFMTTNGFVKFKTKTGGGIDVTTGYPIAATATWSDAMECRWNKVNENLQAKEQGEPIVQVNYTIYLAQATLPSEQTELLDDSGNSLGEFSVISVEYNDTKSIMKILV
jgi:hypothetical protein